MLLPITTMHSQHNAGAFLDRAEGIGALMPKARRLLELRRAVVQLLPDSLSRSCTVANDRQGRLVIFAENSVIAAKLKLLAPALRNQLLEAGQEVTSVVVEVQVPVSRPAQGPEKQALSPMAAAELTALSGKLPESPLKTVLQRLAGRTKAGTQGG
jgi:hypothetical protein